MRLIILRLLPIEAPPDCRVQAGARRLMLKLANVNIIRCLAFLTLIRPGFLKPLLLLGVSRRAGVPSRRTSTLIA
jgi:hypothetical protein